MALKELPVSIYPSKAYIDGYGVSKAEFEEVVRSMYQGFSFRITFT